MHRLSELFNVNHFIVSQASAYAVPFASLKHGSFWNKFLYLITSEIRHWLYQVYKKNKLIIRWKKKKNEKTIILLIINTCF